MQAILFITSQSNSCSTIVAYCLGFGDDDIGNNGIVLSFLSPIIGGDSSEVFLAATTLPDLSSISVTSKPALKRNMATPN